MGKSSSTASTTNNTDARIANDSGVAVSGSGNSINVETVAAQIVGQALDTVQSSDALTADQFNKLLAQFEKGSNVTLLIRRGEIQTFVTIKGLNGG